MRVLDQNVKAAVLGQYVAVSKGSLNEYELDLLRQRSLAARYAKARRGDLVVAAPVGFVKSGDRYEAIPTGASRKRSCSSSTTLRSWERPAGFSVVP